MQLSLPELANVVGSLDGAGLGNGKSRLREPREASEPSAAIAKIRTRFVRSCVEDAGFGRFVYLNGASGRRYVFSSIRPEQAVLYSRGVFALADQRGNVRLLASGEMTGAGRLFVHLPDESEDAESAMRADLEGV